MQRTNSFKQHTLLPKYSEIPCEIDFLLDCALYIHKHTDRYIEDGSYGKAQTFCHKAYSDGDEREEGESIPLSWQSIHEVDHYEKDHA
jgi:hypothetical protein